MKIGRRLSLALVLIAGWGQAQEPAEIERLTEWPAPDSKTKSALKLEVERLRKARTPEMGEQAHEALIEIGATGAPELIKALGKEKDEDARRRISAVLTGITGAPHTRLLAREFEHKSPDVRRFCLRRAASFPDPGTRDAAHVALSNVLTRAAKKKDEPEPEEYLAAALAVTASGSTEALGTVHGFAKKRWKELADDMRAACSAVRVPQAAIVLKPLLKSEDKQDRVASLNLLAVCGSKELVGDIAPLLDEDDPLVRLAAINALRGIVDGAPPLENPSVFQAIEIAQEWKKRI